MAQPERNSAPTSSQVGPKSAPRTAKSPLTCEPKATKTQHHQKAAFFATSLTKLQFFPRFAPLPALRFRDDGGASERGQNLQNSRASGQNAIGTRARTQPDHSEVRRAGFFSPKWRQNTASSHPKPQKTKFSSRNLVFPPPSALKAKQKTKDKRQNAKMQMQAPGPPSKKQTD